MYKVDGDTNDDDAPYGVASAMAPTFTTAIGSPEAVKSLEGTL